MIELIRGMINIKPRHKGCVVTIGNFDGIHLGHQQVLVELIHQSAQLNLPSTLITFEPHPSEYFRGVKASARLTKLREKLTILSQYAIDRVLCLRFNQELANLPASDFISDILVDKLGAKFVLVGDDFRFGHLKQGNFSLLQQAGMAYGFETARLNTIMIEGQRVSSSRVRNALLSGDLALVKELLGRFYSICGRVVRGDERGRLIGFPTANINLRRKVVPLGGVYAVRVFGIGKETLIGVANVGHRPTVGDGRLSLEVHLFDFDKTIYGHYLQVEFVHKIRDEKRFESFDLLRAQINRDAQEAQAFFGACSFV